jgi:hypothetical protein
MNTHGRGKMAREPTYPDEARVGTTAADREASAEAEEADAEMSILEEAQAAKPAEANRTRQIVAGAAIGIGSAALVAALLYAKSSRRKDGNRK